MPLEPSELKARQARIEDQLKEEFSVDVIDRTDQSNPQLLKKLNMLEKTRG